MQQLGARAAGAAGDERPERAVLYHSDDQFDAGGRHCLHQEPIWSETCLPQPSGHLACGALDLLRF